MHDQYIYIVLEIHYQTEKRLTHMQHSHAETFFENFLFPGQAWKLNVKSFCMPQISHFFFLLIPQFSTSTILFLNQKCGEKSNFYRIRLQFL